MIHFSKQIGFEANTLSGAWKTNLELRPEKDWENLVGRAVFEERKISNIFFARVVELVDTRT